MKTITYADAGVDLDAASSFIKAIKPLVKKTHRPGVISDIGGFGGFFSLNTAGYERPVLVSSTDGVGTKLKIAFMMDKHDTVGIDLVAMSANDVSVQGAEPLFFLDYISMGKLVPQNAEAIVEGIVEGCRQAECALIGGETAEMPGMYHDNEYDLAGFVVGIVDNSKIVDGSEIGVGHKLIGIASNGLHSNGYSLVRKICFDNLKLKIDQNIDLLGITLGEELLRPTKIYSSIIKSLLRDFPVHGLAHITGGGIVENLPRILPKSCAARIIKDSWEVPSVFTFLKEAGNVSEEEMLRTFNCGIGLIAIVPETYAQDMVSLLRGMHEKAYIIGDVVTTEEAGNQILWA
ncbi:MAG: phosphoribosylformylglycinamidine cyclo-ligase [Desulfobacterales bacterium C00003104]|jgi:phosphoribosylformylglycinamidine cyclo-ligase|nr:MAG: phosphoribosylformylglycinamidine cyclo-ligase [Desulfobacterales bacterium C00003104]